MLKICTESEYRGVKGVVVLEGMSAGITAGITICTHGDEPVGLSLLTDNDWLKPDSGRVMIVLNNITATQQSLRYVERNMNRLPKGLKNCRAMETMRAQELLPIWQEFDAGALDIHSTSTPFPPLLIARESNFNAHKKVYKNLPIGALVTGLIRNFEGHPAIDFYADAVPKAIIECGQHDDKNGAIFLRQCVEQWLHNLGMKTTSPIITQNLQAHYHVFQAVRLPDNGEVFSYIAPIQPFEKIEAEQPIAKSNRGTIITSPASGYALMAPAANKPLPTKEELFFLADRIS